jgi:hypothetical protein
MVSRLRSAPILTTLIHKLLCIVYCGPGALRIYLSIIISESNHGMEKALVEDTIGALCFDVHLNDLRYLVLLVSYRIDLNGFF